MRKELDRKTSSGVLVAGSLFFRGIKWKGQQSQGWPSNLGLFNFCVYRLCVVMRAVAMVTTRSFGWSRRGGNVLVDGWMVGGAKHERRKAVTIQAGKKKKAEQ